MRGRFVIRQHVEIDGGGSITITDTSPDMDIDPDTCGLAVLEREGGMTAIERAPDSEGRPMWTGVLDNGLPAEAIWEAV